MAAIGQSVRSNRGYHRRPTAWLLHMKRSVRLNCRGSRGSDADLSWLTSITPRGHHFSKPAFALTFFTSSFSMNFGRLIQTEWKPKPPWVISSIACCLVQPSTATR